LTTAPADRKDPAHLKDSPVRYFARFAPRRHS